MVPHSSGREELLRTPQRQCSLYLTASCADLRVATAGAEGGALVIAGAEPPENFWHLGPFDPVNSHDLLMKFRMKE